MSSAAIMIVNALSAVVDKQPGVTGGSVKGPFGLSLEWDHFGVILDSDMLLLSNERVHISFMIEASNFLVSILEDARLCLRCTEISERSL